MTSFFHPNDQTEAKTKRAAGLVPAQVKTKRAAGLVPAQVKAQRAAGLVPAQIRAGINPAARSVCAGINPAARSIRAGANPTARGVVLLVVLVVIALLSLACATFSELMQAERGAARVAVAQAQARALADSGVEMARIFVHKDAEDQKTLGGWYNNEAVFRGVTVIDDEEPQSRGRFTIVAPAVEDGLYEGIRFGLEDESTRLNLNTLIAVDRMVEGAGREILMGLPGMTEDVADAILDWLDEDDEPREFGAEKEEYAALDTPYAPKNGPLETVEELLLVRDVTPWLLFGSDANRNGYRDADEPDADSLEGVDNTDGAMNRGWSAYLTLYSMELNVRPDGQPKINLNVEDMEELYDQLEQAIDEDVATFIVAFRQNGPYTGSKKATKTGGQLDLSKPSKHKFTTILDLIGPNVQVTFKGDRNSTVLQTPFPAVAMEMWTYLELLMDNTTINPSPLIPGRINVNQAPKTVLAGIPGMTDEILDKIISEREPNPTETDDRNRRHETWILQEELVTLEEMKSLIPFLTAGGNVYRVQSIGYFDRGGPAVRIEIVLDATVEPAKVLFFRDLTHLGRGYPKTILGIEASDR